MAAFPESADIPADVLYAGELEIRLEEGLVLATGRALTLSVREFELLVALARRLAIALWRYLKDGVIPAGAVLKPDTGHA